MTSTARALAAPRPRAAVRRWLSDRAWHTLLGIAAGLVFAVVALIVFETLRGALPSLRAFGWKFLITTTWDPVAEQFGALPYVYGTLVSSALALLLALPFGLA